MLFLLRSSKIYVYTSTTFDSFNPHTKKVGANISTTTTTTFNGPQLFSGKMDRFLFGELFFQRSAATGMVDRICQGEDDAALDRKQQAAEVVGDGMGWYGDGG